MTGSAAIIGAGQIGFAAATAFATAGWQVIVYARTRPRWLKGALSFEPYQLGEMSAPAADCVVDTLAFDADDAARYDPAKVGRLIVVSSASVYRDANGRTLDEAAQNGFPDLPVGMDEEQATVAPGPETYSTRKIRMEQQAIRNFSERATIVRPCAIHGPHSRHPREWWFVKRLLDGRLRIPLALNGESRFQTTAAATIGAFAVHAAAHALGGVYNLSDTVAPSVRDIGEMVMARIEASTELVGMDNYPAHQVGRTPWSIPAPFVVSAEKAIRAGFAGAKLYHESAGPAVDWLRTVPVKGWEHAFPQLAAYPWDMFDYASEDALL
ncbi:hypothetical protein ACFCW2_10635 [Qipengyuania sp. DSG2-2]|uniref:hypothetical protein n=1 Tax=Qipengyuania sp. DGS2-2 TaxID=3349631 RepID=UPI0036D2F14A